ncbi:pentapeptide repeat-containing protein [Streptomyces sp. MMG1533]|uniref:pentapeptide repeat-containing protein n=1 Tax=Streptomyces sp. MMG1533 TaxID=1415546 RepID=UPI0006AE338A|nr:pentapeptide repeat-containing protein [Streptomyces sp. MMG1533]
MLALLGSLPWLVIRGPYEIDAKYLNREGLADGSAALVTGLRTALVACVAAFGAGLALLYTARNYRLTRRGQITERFTKALERLGSDQLYVRIGGILALEQIVQDAPEQAATDAAHVLGVFIRARAPQVAPTAPARSPTVWRWVRARRDLAKLPPVPAADVQAALTALTRAESRPHVDPREVLDLHGLHLARADLHEADLTGANLQGATLTEAVLLKADLTKANLHGARLTMALLGRAKLAKANLQGAELTDASLAGATLTWAYLAAATLTRADLSGATLTDAHLGNTTFTEAVLSGANLSRARGCTQPPTGVLTDETTILPPEWQQSTTP